MSWNAAMAPSARADLLFGKGNGVHLKALTTSGAEAVGVDWTVELGEAARRTGGRVALQEQSRSGHPVRRAGSDRPRSGARARQLCRRQ